MRIKILIIILLLLDFQTASGAENEYGIVKAWFKGINATVDDVQLKIGEPVEVKVEVISKIKGDASLKLKEPGITRGFYMLNGPGEMEEWITNVNIESGWSKTYVWTLAPNGAWKNGNAPLNIVVQFNKGMNDKIIQFTIANPYILDEQYAGAAPTPAPVSDASETAVPPPAKNAPFLTPALTALMILAALKWKRKG